jgi:hypothetical protein
MRDGTLVLMQSTILVLLELRNNKFNVFGNYNYNKSKNENRLNLYRTTAADSSFDQHSVMLNEMRSHGFKAGVDYYASRRSTMV